MLTKCKICGSEEVGRAFALRELMHGTREEFGYFQCIRCECLQIELVPVSLGKYYEGGYYSYKPVQEGYGLKQKLIWKRNRYALLKQGLLGRALNLVLPTNTFSSLCPLRLKGQSRVLDVGCGAGTLLHAMRSAGMSQVMGIDPFIEADIVYGNGLRIEKKTLQEINGPWDVIMFHHSFEHIEDQHGTLDRVFALLADEGHCVLRVPTVTSYAWEHYGANWVQLDVPRHLYLHSPSSVRILAEAHGFDLVGTTYDSTAFQFWGSEQYQRGIPLFDEKSYAKNPAMSIFKQEEIEVFARRAAELNAAGRGDQAIFYLKKRAG